MVNSGGFWLWELGGSPRLIAAEAEGKRCVLNDCIADPEGRVFSGSCFYDADRPDYELGCLFRLDQDGSVHVVDEGFRISNGLGFSPDERTLYFTDSAARVIYAYDYSRKDGALRHRRVFAEVPVEEGLPDGLTVDAEGFVWSARWFGGCVVRYDPDGKVERRIAIPAMQTSSLAFGGPDLTDIFVTSASSPNRWPWRRSDTVRKTSTVAASCSTSTWAFRGEMNTAHASRELRGSKCPTNSKIERIAAGAWPRPRR